FPGFSNAAIDEVFNAGLIPQMFAVVAQGNKSSADSVRDTAGGARRIFRRGRARVKIYFEVWRPRRARKPAGADDCVLRRACGSELMRAHEHRPALAPPLRGPPVALA